MWSTCAPYVIALCLTGMVMQIFSVSSCQFLAQISHPDTPAKEHGKALLKRNCQWVQG
jgi:hypothetical protein